MRNCVTLLAFAFCFILCGALAGETVSVVCTRPSHRYGIDEKAEFAVTSPTNGLPVAVSFSRGYLPAIETVVTTTPAIVSFALGEPGFVLCRARPERQQGPTAKDALAGAGFVPESIRTALPPPKDYDAFWKRAFAEQAAIEPDFVSTPIGGGLCRVSCRTVQGTRLYGFLHMPKGVGPFPLMVSVGSGDSIRFEDEAVKVSRWAYFKRRGFLFIHLPDWEPTEKTWPAALARHKRWMKEKGYPGPLYGWKNDKEPRERWYYRCILGSCRLVDCVVKRPDVDTARVYYQGGSTGGGYGVFISAFSPHIRAAICEVPNYGNAGGPSVGRPSGEDDRGSHWQTSLYYDAAYCAPRITCPVFMTCGYVDNSCVPETVYCIYNALTCEKTMFDKVENGHGDTPPGYDKVKEDWLRRVLDL